ncbi:MAG: hypothetical protein LBS50_04265 [Prevotellaceae bacterium]|jgi:hypothetical protein|nr:hypothetical protein [Prevotellaceae bacterium]
MKKIGATVFGLLITLCCNSQTVYLYTPNGSAVYAFQRTEMSAADIQYYTNEFATNYPLAEVLADASLTYNCHSYAWNLIEEGVTCWLNQDPDLHLYWDDGSYELTTEANAEKVFYYSGDHSAVKSTTHSGKYESKWGAMPLMRHSPEYGPSIYNMQYRRYYHCATHNFTNQTVLTNTTVTNCGDIIVEDVSVENGAKLTLDAKGDVIINSDFEVELGSELEIK